MFVAIPNYGCGNLQSVVRMIEKVGGSARIVSEPRELEGASRIVLAGVGAFDHGARNLRDKGWIDALNAATLGRKVPTLGICLGMQLLARASQEGGLPGLGWLAARSDRFSFEKTGKLKVPHMGWNEIRVVKPNPLLSSEDKQRFYFVHSFHLVCEDAQDAIAITSYGYDFVSAIRKGNVFGVQFHPEKSHRFGMGVMRGFLSEGVSH